jgi:2-keto-4-pentenoate hydratase/2-oxohepta-3-ene-1,7-dioic acid hydratase in catechol pathway
MIVPRQFVPDPYDLTITLSVNGKVYQDESTRDMMIGIERQIAFLSERVELMPGDVICTGSPYGNGSAFGVFLQPGDVMEGTITALGTQRNRCEAEV